MNFEYSFEKDTWLKENRNISFEDVIVAMESGGLLDE